MVNFPIISLYRILEESKKKKIFSKMSFIGIDLLMIFGPLIVYIFQIRKFYKTKSSKGFSKYMCLLLFLGNILRVFFWYGIRFKNSLLYQSIGVVIFQIILIHLCIKFSEEFYNSKTYLPEIKNSNDRQTKLESKNNINIIKNFIAAYFSKTFKPNYIKYLKCNKTFNPTLFWKWKEESEYYKYMIFIVGILILICTIFKKYVLLFQIIGILSAFCETIICVPQIISNYKTKVTKNISFMMIVSWLLGDCFRLIYNINYSAPIQLIIAISIQIFFDFILSIQLIFYRKNNYKGKEKVNANKKQIEEINQLMKSIDELNIAK